MYKSLGIWQFCVSSNILFVIVVEVIGLAGISDQEELSSGLPNFFFMKKENENNHIRLTLQRPSIGH